MSDPDDDWHSFTLQEKFLTILPPAMVWLVVVGLIWAGCAIGHELAKHLWGWSWAPALVTEGLLGWWVGASTRNFYVGLITFILLGFFTILGFWFTYTGTL